MDLVGVRLTPQCFPLSPVLVLMKDCTVGSDGLGSLSYVLHFHVNLMDQKVTWAQSAV